MKTLNPELKEAYQGSYYTICGAGGSLDEWLTGYNRILEDKKVGKPQNWFECTGADVNAYATTHGTVVDPFEDDLVILMFPLDGLDVGKLAMVKLNMEDRWFDDVVDNMVRNTWDADDEYEVL